VFVLHHCADFDLLGHIMRRQGLDSLVVTGDWKERRQGASKTRRTYLDSLCALLKDNTSPLQFISFRGQKALALHSRQRCQR